MAEQDLREQVSRAAQEAGLDPEFVSRVVDAESKWNPLAVSKAGARGLMQLMPETAKQYGVTRLMDPAENIKAGVAYLKDLSQKYPGRPDLVAAAYNAGPSRVDKAGGVPDIKETKDYVQKVAPEGDQRTLAQRIKAKYPGVYDDLSDTDLEAKISAKHPGTYDDLPRTKTKAAAQKAPEPAAQPDQPKAKEPEDYWGGFRKGWEEGGLGGFRGYVNAFAGAPRRLYEGIGATIEGLSNDPGQTVINAVRGLAAVPGQIVQATREAGTNPEGFGRAIGEPISDALLATQAPKVPGIAARAALHHVLPGGGRMILKGAQVLSDIGRAAGEAGEATAEAPKPVVPPGPGPGGKGWYKPWEGAERERIVAGKTPAPEPAAPAQPAAPAATSGQPLTVVGSPASKFWIAKNKLGVKVNAQQMPKAIALIRDGMEPEAAIKQVIGGSGATPAEELAKQLGTPSDAEVAADMGKRARSGQKTLMGRYGDQ